MASCFVPFLHKQTSLLCSRGKKGTEEQAAVNEKRIAYCKTGAGLEMKKACCERANATLIMLYVSKKAHLCHETIEKLVKIL